MGFSNVPRRYGQGNEGHEGSRGTKGDEEEGSNEGHEGDEEEGSDEGHEGDEEEGGHEGHEGDEEEGGHEGHEGYEEEGSHEGHEGSDEGDEEEGSHEGHEGHEGDEEEGSHEGHEGHEEEACEQDRDGQIPQGTGAPRNQGEDLERLDGAGPVQEQARQGREPEEVCTDEEVAVDPGRRTGTQDIEDHWLRRHQEGHSSLCKGQGVLQPVSAALSHVRVGSGKWRHQLQVWDF